MYILVGDVDNGRALHGWGAGGIWEIFSFSFSVNLKLSSFSKKYNVLIKIKIKGYKLMQGWEHLIKHGKRKELPLTED